MFDDKSRYLDRFGWLLGATATAIVMLSLIDLTPSGDGNAATLGGAATTALVGVALLLALRASGLAPRWRRIADVLVSLVVATLIIATLTELISSPNASATATPAPLVLVLLSVVAPVVVVRRLVQHRTVKVGTLLGAISAYLLIPVAYFYAFLAVDTYESSTFFVEQQSTTSFMYFSLTSLTTLGYGDLAPVTNVGRLLATSEAVVGQVYLVTFVAMIVGLIAHNRRARFTTPEEDET